MHKEIRGILVLQALKVILEGQVHKALRGIREILGQLVLRVDYQHMLFHKVL